MGRLRKRRFGQHVTSDDGFTVDVAVCDFPGVKVRYRDGPRTMGVFAELASEKDLNLFPSTMQAWEPRFNSDSVGDATRQFVLDRILAALSVLVYDVQV